jgi:hypothetical protein
LMHGIEFQDEGLREFASKDARETASRQWTPIDNDDGRASVRQATLFFCSDRTGHH